MGHLRAGCILCIALAVTPLLCLLQFSLLVVGRWQEIIPHYYHQFICRLISLRIKQYGSPTTDRPLLIVSNHSSWMDILVISASTRVCFVSKKEVGSWPIFGTLAKLQRTVFIERAERRTVATQRDAMHARLEQGQRLSLFPEGTSSDGRHVLSFKSSLFSLATVRPGGASLKVQPVSIAYVGLDGLPVGLAERPKLTWFGEMSLAGHIWGVLAAGPVTVAVIFHEPVTLDRFGSRKKLAAYCEDIVAQGLSDARSGRLSLQEQGHSRPSTSGS